ncbi:MAG: UvrD-helicase domain-containing protein, partial [Actinomycetia bacterium]|nr:UvrD-helicase domain-containing protein [Actinomycetes bacterium]
MNSRDPVFAKSSRLYRFFASGPVFVSLVDGRLRLEQQNGRGTEHVSIERIDDIRLSRSLFWTRLTVHKTDQTRHSIGGLDLQVAVRFRDAVIENARQHADELGPRLEELGKYLDRVLDGGSYVKHSASKEFREVLASAEHQPGGLVRNSLRPRARTALDRFAPLESPKRFEAERSKANKQFIEMSIPRVKAATRSVLPYPVTDEQAETIATDEDVTLVLAGAGTGKTVTIVGKVAHLVRNEGVRPDEILVLAYNRKAAEEIRERLPPDLSGSRVSTFHAFGRSVIAKSGGAPSISKVAEDRSVFI